jgi:hypothetical protein
MSEFTYNPDAPLERSPGDTPKSHDALLRYAEMGPTRSLAKLAQLMGKKKTYVSQLELWSRMHHWQERIKLHDAEIVRQKLAADADAYRASLIAHRDRYRQTGEDLHTVARGILVRLAAALENNTLPLNVATLHALVRTFETAAELEAHCLSLDRLLPMLTYAEENNSSLSSNADLPGASGTRQPLS